MMIANTPSRQIKSVRTSLKLIDQLQARGGATLAELTEELDLSKGSIHNHLATLKMEGYVVNERGRYRLGLRFLTHGMAAKNTRAVGSPIFQTIEPTAEALSQPVWWVAEEFGRGYFLEYATPESERPIYGCIGKRSYLHTHALGKAMLAVSDDEYVERVAEHHGLPEQTRQTTTDLEELLDELETTRERGFAVSEGEAVLGIQSVGVGFRDAMDRRHAIGVFGHSQNFAGDQSEDVGRRLAETVADLERALEEREGF